MKYLRHIFESDFSTKRGFISFGQEVKEFAEDCLTYLLDDGFKVEPHIVDLPNYYAGPFIYLKLTKESYPHNLDGFTWDEVKDYYIPFIKMLVVRYELNYYEVDGQEVVRFNYGSNTAVENFTYDQIVEDDLFTTVLGDGISMDMRKTTKYGFRPDSKIYSIGVKISLV